MIIKFFCTTGAHSVDIVTEDPNAVPEGWSRPPAEVIPWPTGPDEPWHPGIWYLDMSSPTRVLCCPNHPIIDVREDKEDDDHGHEQGNA